MNYTPLTSGSASASGSPNVSVTLDTTGAKLIVVSTSWNNANGSVVLGDNQGNTPTGRTSRIFSASGNRIYEYVDPITSVTHTFTLTGTLAPVPSICVMVFGGNPVSPFDQESGNGTASGTSIQPGNLLPNGNNALVVCGMTMGAANTGTPTLNGGFTYISRAGVPSNAMGCGLGYLNQTTAANVNPTWALNGTTHGATSQIVYLPGPAEITDLLSGKLLNSSLLRGLARC